MTTPSDLSAFHASIAAETFEQQAIRVNDRLNLHAADRDRTIERFVSSDYPLLQVHAILYIRETAGHHFIPLLLSTWQRVHEVSVREAVTATLRQLRHQLGDAAFRQALAETSLPVDTVLLADITYIYKRDNDDDRFDLAYRVRQDQEIATIIIQDAETSGDAFNVLVSHLDDDSRGIRRDILEALRKLNDTRLSSVLVARLNIKPSVFTNHREFIDYIEALIDIADDVSLAAMKQMMTDISEDFEDRDSASRALYAMGTAGRRILEELATSEDEVTRELANSWLRMYKDDQKDE